MAAVLISVSRSSLTLIDPRPRSGTHVDPVVWAKTVAPLAVPFRAGVLGPSGTASPIFNLLDVFLERRSHGSQLGREIGLHRRSYPLHWRLLLDAAERVSVADYVASHPRLIGSLESVREAYAGPDGFLGTHRRKAYGYLAVAFKVGRGVTIGGFRGPPQARTWNEVDTALTQSRAERLPSTGECGAQQGPPPHGAAARGGQVVSAGELARHNDAVNGWWVSIDGRVHDVTDFVERHPGGSVVLRAHAGLDATTAFRRAHAGHPGVERLLARTDVGALSDPDLTAAPQVYRAWVDALFTVVELQNAFRLDRSFAEGTDLCVPSGGRSSAFQADRAMDTCLRFANAYLPQLADEVLRPLGEWVSTADVGRRSGASRSGSVAVRARLRDDLDRVDGTLAVVKSLLCAGARSLEERGDDALGGRELGRLVDRAIAAIVGRDPDEGHGVLPGPRGSTRPQDRVPPVPCPAWTSARRELRRSRHVGSAATAGTLPM
jgi:hypothetical protein